MKKTLQAKPSIPRLVRPGPLWPKRLEMAARVVFDGFPEGKLATASAPGSACGDLTAVIGLTGAIEGSLRVCCSSATARSIAGLLLGVPEPSEEQIHISMGEVAHRIARTIQKDIASPARECLLAPPMIVSLEDDECELPGESYLVAYEFLDSPVWIRLNLCD